MKLEPIKDELLSSFEADAARIVAQPDYPADNASVILRYLGEAAARIRVVETALEPLAELGHDLDQAQCHAGITDAARCGRCSKVLAARAALKVGRR